MNDADNRTETMVVMYKTERNGPWLRFEAQLTPSRLAELKSSSKEDVNKFLGELIEPTILGQTILGIDYKL